MSNVIEMRHITKMFPGIIANDDITLTLKKGEIHALLGENGAGKSTLMSVLFGLYKPEKGEILKNGEVVSINDPNDANALGIGMVHQHFKLVDNFTVVENIILGAEQLKRGVLDKVAARKKVVELSEKYGLAVDPDAIIEDISVGMQQRVEILKMLFRNNEILIFDEPTAVLTPQEIDELMEIMRGFAKEGKSILFITHKLNEIMAVADTCTVLRKGKYIGTVDISSTTKQELSKMMVGRDVEFTLQKKPVVLGEEILKVTEFTVPSNHSKKNAVTNVSLNVRRGEVVCLAGIEGNGQSEFIQALTGLMKCSHGTVELCGEIVTKKITRTEQLELDKKNAANNSVEKKKEKFSIRKSIRYKSEHGMSHIPEDRHKHGLILDFNLANNIVLQTYHHKEFQKSGFVSKRAVYRYSNRLIEKFDIRSGQGSITTVRSMSGGNQQKAIIAREIAKDPELLIAVQPTRGLDVGAIEYIHHSILETRDSGKGVLLVSLELDEVMNLSDRILVMYEGEIVAELDPKSTTVQELGLYMAGSKKEAK